MTPEIDAIKTNIRRLRAELVAAERELAEAYGPRIDPLTRLLCSCFEAGELRRFLRSVLGTSLSGYLPEHCSLVELARAGSIALADEYVSRDELHSSLLRERPRREHDITAGLKDWGAP